MAFRWQGKWITGGGAGGAPVGALARARLAGAALLAIVAVGVAVWRISGTRGNVSVPPTPRTPVQLILALEATAAAEPDARRAYEELGAACLRLGHVLSAREAFRRAVRLGGESIWLRQQLAWCALRLDRRDEALLEYRRLLQMEARERYGAAPAGAYLRLAAAAARMGETEAARRALAAIPAAVRASLLAPRTAEERLQLLRYLALMESVAPPEAVAGLARRVMARMPEEPAGHAAAARAALREGRPEEALRHLEKALAVAPDRAELYALKGDALFALPAPRRSAARQAYRRAVTLDPSLGPAFFRLGQLALEAGDGKEALRAFMAARAVGTEPVASLRGLARAAKAMGEPLVATRHWGEFHEASGDLDAARRAFDRLLTHPTTKLDATLRLADLDARHQRLRPALRRLEAAVRETSGSVDLWQSLARLYRAFGRLPDARAAWRKAAALDPAAAPEAHRALAVIAESLGDFDEAERQYGEALRLAPDDAATHRFLGALLFSRRGLEDRLERAIALLERSASLDGSEAASFVALGHAYDAAGRRAEALLTLRHAIDLAPGAGAVYLDVGRLARRLGHAEESREMLVLHRRYREVQRQLETLRSTIAARPADPAVRRALAEYYFAARDYGRAATEYERALSLGARTLPPAERRVLRERLAEAYERLARREDAAAQLALVRAP
jgi:tetratricopeptide (TPR) repeat protein